MRTDVIFGKWILGSFIRFKFLFSPFVIQFFFSFKDFRYFYTSLDIFFFFFTFFPPVLFLFPNSNSFSFTHARETTSPNVSGGGSADPHRRHTKIKNPFINAIHALSFSSLSQSEVLLSQETDALSSVNNGGRLFARREPVTTAIFADCSLKEFLLSRMLTC